MFTTLNLRNTDLRNPVLLCQILASNTTLTQVNISQNFIKPQMLEQVKQACLRNQLYTDNQKLPLCQRELQSLLRNKDLSGETVCFKSVFQKIREDRSELMKTIEEREAILEQLRSDTQTLRRQHEVLRRQTESKLQDLDTELESIDQRLAECHRDYETKVSQKALGVAIVKHKAASLQTQLEETQEQLTKKKAHWQSK